MQDPQPCPSLQGSFFKADAPDFNDSEKRIIKSYDQDVSYPKTVRDMICHVQQLQPSDKSGRLNVNNKVFLFVDNVTSAGGLVTFLYYLKM